MKTFHIHVSVQDIEKSVLFYSSLFGKEPTKQKNDYAKWMLNDPKVNFAISNRGTKEGVDHLGIQVESDSELEEITSQLEKAEQQLFDQGVTECCYTRSNKAWVEDPSGVAWETYVNMADVEIFGAEKSDNTCCVPKTNPQSSSC